MMDTDQRQFEKVSAWMDMGSSGSGADIADGLLKNRDLGEVWERYHLIGDILRKEVSSVDHSSLAAAIRDRLADEPVIFAPRRPAHHGRNLAGGWTRWVAGMGMAASVAALIIVGVTRMEQQPASDFVASSEKGSPDHQEVVAAVAEPLSQAAANGSPINSKINRYLTDHSKFMASGGSLNGMVPLATLVSHNE